MRIPKLLVSVKEISEVLDVVEGGTDIVDVKDPSRGSLGLPDIEVVKEVVNIVKPFKGKEVSMALGDVRKYDNYLKYIAYVGGILGVNYVKVGLAMNDIEEALYTAKNIRDILASFSNTHLILVSYADHVSINSLEPMKLIEIAIKAGARGVMIDTIKKSSGLSTFDILPIHYIEKFVEKAHQSNLLAAIAGGLKHHHIPLCVKLGFDVIGFRGAACTGGRDGKVSKELVLKLRMEIDKHSKNSINR